MILADICHLIVDCPHSTAEDEGRGIPLIRTPNIGRGRFNLEGVHRVCESVYRKRCARAVPQDGDIIFAREAPAGNAAIIKGGQKMCLGQRTVLIRPDATKVCPEYLVYYLLASEQQYKLLGTANGATVAHVNLPAIREMKVDNLPPLPVQRRIADILSAYDDLIENNRKQIKLLEEAAQRLYKEWFIDFRFPGHEHTPIINGLPAGWVRKSFSEVFTYERGRSYSSSEIGDSSEILLVNLKNIKAWGGYNQNAEKCFLGAVKQSQFLKHNDIVMAVTDMTPERRLVGHVALIPNLPHPATFSMDLIRIIPKFLPNLFLYATLSFQKYGSKISLLANGTNVLHLKPDSMMKQIMVIPPECLIDKYEEYFSVIRIKIEYWEKQIRDSIESRDRLLPKLMSREFDVSEIGA